MPDKPVCPLCSESLSRESNVWVQTGGTNTLCYSLAWVCTNCGACWPIGVTGGLFKGNQPIWEDGVRKA